MLKYLNKIDLSIQPVYAAPRQHTYLVWSWIYTYFSGCI